MEKYYSNLIILESKQKEGILCKGRGWEIVLEQNLLCNTIVDGEPAKEIIIYAQSNKRAEYVANLILAAHCLYTGDLCTYDDRTVFQNRAETIEEIEKQLSIGGHSTLGIYNLPVACLISAKASQKNAYQYAIFKYLLSYRTVPIIASDLDPQRDWRPGKAISMFPKELVSYTVAIILYYSVLEELSLDIHASNEEPSMINGKWNPKIKSELEECLISADIDLSEHLLWTLRDTPSNIERKRKPTMSQKTEWSYYKIRDIYVEVIDAIAYSSWLRSKISAHKLSTLSRSLKIYDVANVQHLARRLLLETLGFWRYHENTS